MRRFIRSDYYGYSGVEPLPSGEPFIGEATLPSPDGSSAPDEGVEIVVSGTPDGIKCGVFGETGWIAEFTFPCERDAVAFARLIEGRNLSRQGIEGLKGH